MPRPLFVPETPSAIYTVQGGNLALTDYEKTTYLGFAPSSDSIYTDDNLDVVRFRKQSPGEQLPQKDILQFTFRAPRSNISLSAMGDGLHLYLDHVLYQVAPSSKQQTILLITQDGADALYIDDNLENPLQILSGAGNDYLCVGGSHALIVTGEGDDTVRLTSGTSHIQTGDGDDSVQIASSGTARVYGGAGDDILRAGGGLNFIDGGPGDDVLSGGSGHNILSGGDGNDAITAGSGTHSIYPGQGHDRVSRLKPIDTVYSQADTTLVAITPAQRREWMLEKLSSLPLPTAEQILAVLMPDDPDAINHTPVAASDAGKRGIQVIGAPAFIARVEADLALFRLSPNGQRLLQALDAAAQNSGQAVRIEYFEMDNAAFSLTPPLVDPTIRDGQPGPRAAGGRVEYNPFFSPTGSLPIIGLYHELCHAYNAVTGTVAPGETLETDGTQSANTPNRERQAVGLPIAMAPFDFDFDPATPPAQTNPEAFTENGLRKEFGLPPRTTYLSSKKRD
jgi:hypothetical protein